MIGIVTLLGLGLGGLAGLGPGTLGPVPEPPAACAAPAPPPAVEMAAGVRIVAADPRGPRRGANGPPRALDTPGGPCFFPRPRSLPPHGAADAGGDRRSSASIAGDPNSTEELP